MPMKEHYGSFGPDENPVEYVMNQLAAVYPQIYQDRQAERIANIIMVV